MLGEENPDLLKKEQLNSIINKFIRERHFCKKQVNILQWLNSMEYYEAEPDQKKFIQNYLDKILNDSSIEADLSLEATQNLGSVHNDQSDIFKKNYLNAKSLEIALPVEATQDLDSEHNDKVSVIEKNQLNKTPSTASFFNQKSFRTDDFQTFESNPEEYARSFSIL